MNEITIREDFRTLIPPLAPDEYRQLEANLLKDGCRDPLVVWGDTLIDGHNRYEICGRHNIEFEIAEVEFESDDAAKNWIIYNQLGRRNLAPAQASLLRGKLYLSRKKDEHDGGAGKKRSEGKSCPHSTAKAIADETGVSERTVKNDAKFAEAVEKLGVEKEVMSGEDKRSRGELISTAFNHRAQGTGENEWYTPKKYIDAARQCLGNIDLDPASSEQAQQTVKAASFYSKEQDGLKQEWHGNVWCNPPYSQPHIYDFCEKMVEEVQAGRVKEAILLTHNYTDTAWFHLAESEATAICFTRGRIAFEGSDGRTCQPTQGQAFFYFGDDVMKFTETFGKFGFIR